MKLFRMWPVAIVPLLFLGGCAEGHPPTYPVTGRVRFAEGAPVTGGTVEFLSSKRRINARGTIRPDGSFRLSTFGEGDGAVAGNHRAIVVQFAPGGDALFDHPAHQPQAVVDRRYADYDFSGLEFTVTSEGSNQFEIVVTRAAEGA